MSKFMYYAGDRPICIQKILKEHNNSIDVSQTDGLYENESESAFERFMLYINYSVRKKTKFKNNDIQSMKITIENGKVTLIAKTADSERKYSPNYDDKGFAKAILHAIAEKEINKESNKNLIIQTLNICEQQGDNKYETSIHTKHGYEKKTLTLKEIFYEKLNNTIENMDIEPFIVFCKNVINNTPFRIELPYYKAKAIAFQPIDTNARAR